MSGGEEVGNGAAAVAPPEPEPPRPRLRRSDAPTRHLFVANAGPIVGDTLAAVADAFQPFGEVVSVRTLDPDKAQLLVTMSSVPEAAGGQAALHGERCAVLGGRKVWVQFSAVASEGSEAASQEDLWCPARAYTRSLLNST
jgi:alkylated DNA repair protein alkB family protein 8